MSERIRWWLCGRKPAMPDTKPPPWWVWFEAPRWFPDWLHLLTCTYCRGMRAYGREIRRGVPR